MARADVLIRLVRAGVQGDMTNFVRAAESLVAEEKEKKHTVLANRLSDAMRVNGVPSQAGRFLEAGIAGYLQERHPERRVQDLVLEPATLEIIKGLVEEQHRFELLHTYGLSPRHRVMLAGPPGNGKTALAEAIAYELALPLLTVRYDGVIGKYLGETSSRLRKIFEHARQARCVLFFDEFDAIGKERGDERETGEIKRVVSGLLMQIDDLPSYTTVVVASNHPQLLDTAAWRRFQIRIYMPAPTREQLGDFVAGYAEKARIDFGLSPRTIADKLGKVSYAEAEEFCLDVLRRATLDRERECAKRVTMMMLKQWGVRKHAEEKVNG